MSSKKFRMHALYSPLSVQEFTEHTAPKWLTSEDTVKGSTMDRRWFWNEHVLTLKVGQSVKTDFSKITRIN